MIKQVMMSPAKALYHWLENGMSMKAVLSHTDFSRWSDLHDEYVYDLIAQEWTEDDMMMSPDERQREEDVAEVWDVYGDYLREMVPPDEYADEIRRLVPVIKKTRQMQDAARSQRFRESVRRRNGLQ